MSVIRYGAFGKKSSHSPANTTSQTPPPAPRAVVDDQRKPEGDPREEEVPDQIRIGVVARVVNPTATIATTSSDRTASATSTTRRRPLSERKAGMDSGSRRRAATTSVANRSSWASGSSPGQKMNVSKPSSAAKPVNVSTQCSGGPSTRPRAGPSAIVPEML